MAFDYSVCDFCPLFGDVCDDCPTRAAERDLMARIADAAAEQADE